MKICSRRIAITLFFCTWVFLAVGCPQLPTPEQIGSVHVAVLSRTAWDDYKSELQPMFSITPPQALASAVPDTLQMDQALFDSFRAAVALKIAPSAALPAGFGTGQSGEGLTTTAAPAVTQGSFSAPTTVIDKPSLQTDPFLQYQAATALFQEVKLIDRYIEDAAIHQGYKPYVIRLQISVMPLSRHQPYDAYIDLGFFLDRFTQPAAAPAVSMPSSNKDLRAVESKISKMISGLRSTTQPAIQRTEHDLAMGPEMDTVYALVANSEWSTRLQAISTTYESDKETRPISAAIQAVDELCMLQKDIDSALAKAAPLPDVQEELKKMRELVEKAAAPLKTYLASHPPHQKTPLIVPLLVTDEVEAALASRRAEHLQELSLSLAAAYAGIGGQVSADSIQQAMRNSLGRDYNSLLGVARINDNTLRVRVGARQMGAVTDPTNLKQGAREGENYEMDSQTHNVSLLVLVPECEVMDRSAQVYFGSHTSFVNAKNGAVIEARSQNSQAVKASLYGKFGAAYSQLLRRANPPCDATPQPVAGGVPTQDLPGADKKRLQETLYRATLAAQNSDYEGFLTTLRAKEGGQDIGDLNRLWLDLTDARVGSQTDSGQFTVPRYRNPGFRSAGPGAMVVLLDDGKQTVTTVGGAHGLDPLKMSATWTFKQAPPLPESVTLIATKIDVQGSQVTLTFPSLKACGLAPPSMSLPTTTPPQSVQVHFSHDGIANFGWAYKTVDSQLPLVANISLNPAKIAPDKDRRSTPDLIVTFTQDFHDHWLALPGTPPEDEKKFPRLSIDGANLDSVTQTDPQITPTATPAPTESVKNPGTWLIKGDGRYRISLSGLAPGTSVKFTLTTPTPTFKVPDPVSRPVDNLPPRQ